MKKVVIISIIVVCGATGYLYYDWHVHTKKMAAEPSIALYSWTDEKGNKHFTNTAPPQSVKNITETKGYKYIEPPLVVKIRDKTIDFYKWIKNKIFKKKKKKRN